MSKKEEIEIDINLDNDIQEKVSQKNLPDKNTEFFWYGFKNTIINLIHNLKQDKKDSKNNEMTENKKNEMIKNKDNGNDNDNFFNFILKDLEEKSNLYNEMQKINKMDNK